MNQTKKWKKISKPAVIYNSTQKVLWTTEFMGFCFANCEFLSLWCLFFFNFLLFQRNKKNRPKNSFLIEFQNGKNWNLLCETELVCLDLCEKSVAGISSEINTD